MNRFQWAEDDFDLPAGAVRLGPSEPAPVSGRTYVMYHGTTRKNAGLIKATGFRQSAGGMLGRGVYLSRDLKKASRYPIEHPESDRVVITVVVKVGKVVAINHQGHPLQKSWHDHGYNTAWVPPNCGMVKSGLEENCVWDPNHITIIKLIQPTPVSNSVRLGPSEPAPVSCRSYVMYHGTTREKAWSIQATGFRQSAGGMLGCGVYLSRDLEKASRYPLRHPESDRVVIKVVVNVGNVVAINHQGHPLQKSWHDHGYDTAWVPPNCGMVKSGAEENCVWNHKRIQIIATIQPTPVSNSGWYGNMRPILQDLQKGIPIGCAIWPILSVMGMNLLISAAEHVTVGVLETGFVQPALRGFMDDITIYVSNVQARWALETLDNEATWARMTFKGLPPPPPPPPEPECSQNDAHAHTLHSWTNLLSLCTVANNRAADADMSRFRWAEDDSDLPSGAVRLGHSEPVSGRTYVMYHGTTRDHAWSIQDTGFHQSVGGMLGRGVYLTRDLEKASRYPIGHPESDRVVIKVVVKVGKVVAINRQGHPLQKSWHDHGYNTAWVPPNCGMVKSGAEENCVWNPKRIQIIKLIRPISTNDDDEDPVSDRTYVMYHGTTRKNAGLIKATGFRQSAGGMLGRGVYLSRDLKKASRYPIDHPESDRVVIKVVVNVGKVVAINHQGHPLQKSWHDHGYNTAWVPPNCGMVKSGAEENCVWNPKRIMIIEIIRPTSTSDKEDDDEDNEKDNDEDNNYDHIYYEDDDGEDDVDRDQSTSECVIL
ncbi:uncharacterized protein LOC118288982 [Scophthalmus maximus]|uniref:uncharacterized protein LOC118288982 n=1 Tax=Scophthalmus maximus TaxID=52904 RepID=UPI001FA91C34|nr:uncharacterized protein LOC118288982 [Scophthalmus maximus]